jgi:hypothetical protein
MMAAGLVTGAGAAGAAGSHAASKPTAPTAVQARSQADEFVISWGAPTKTGSSPVSSYTATVKGNGLDTTCTTSTLTCTTSGAANGKTYKIKVVASNASGSGRASRSIKALAGVPYPPSGLVATAGNASASVSFVPPTIDNAVIENYTITASPGGNTCESFLTSCTVTGLTNGQTYTFTGTSVGTYGTSIPSAPSAPITLATVPGVPTGVSATATTISGVPGAYVNYTAPASNGESPITGYTTVVVDETTSTTTTVSGSSSLTTVTGLDATDSYTFSVYATNARGNSAASTPVQAVPEGPTSVTDTNVGDGTATISWTPSDVTLGNPVTGFGVTSFDLTALAVGPSTSVSSSTTSTTLSGLTLGDQYDVCVSAQNSQVAANETCSEFIAYSAPPGPTDVTPVSNGNGTGSVSWNLATGAPAGNPVTGYQVGVLDITTLTLNSSTTVSNTTTSEPLTGLNVGDTYDVCVASQSQYTTDQTSSCTEFTA